MTSSARIQPLFWPTLAGGLLASAHTPPVVGNSLPPEVASLAFGNLSWDTPLLFTEDSENEAHSLVPRTCFSSGCIATLQHDFWAPPCRCPASWCSGVLQSPPWTVPPTPPLEHSCGCSPDGGGVGPSPQGLVLGWLSANCGPNSPGLGKPVGLGFPLSHLRKESPSSGSEEEQ